MNDKEVIIDRIDILHYISEEIQCKKVGSNTFRGEICPLCKGHDCFTIYPEKKQFHCYQCSERGNIIDYVMKREELDFLSALKQLAKKSGVELSNSNANKDWYEQKQKIEKIFFKTAKYYHENFKKNPEAVKIISNHRARTSDTMKKVMYGLADGKLHNYLISLGYDENTILESGLCRKNDNGKIFDFISENKFVYPVAVRKVISDFQIKDYFVEKKERKDYQLVSSNKLNDALFYGQDGLYKDSFILVEGPEDRISILQAYQEILKKLTLEIKDCQDDIKKKKLQKKRTALENSFVPPVAILGSISEKQLSFIDDLCNHKRKIIYLAFDPDTQGEKYTKKIVNLLLNKADIRKLLWDFDKGDIDDFLKKAEPESILSIIENATNILYFLIDSLPKDFDEIQQNNPHVAMGYYDPLIDLICKEQEEIIKNSYIDKLAKKVGQTNRQIKALVMKRMGLVLSAEPEEEPEEKKTIFRWEKNHQYWKDDGQNKMKLSDYTIDIIGKIEMEIRDKRQVVYNVILTNSKGLKSKPLELYPQDRITTRKLNEVCSGHHEGCYFYGRDNDLLECLKLEEDSAKIDSIVCYFQRYGWIREHQIWLFNNCAVQHDKVYEPDENGIIKVGKIGFQSQGVRIYSGDTPNLNLHFKPTKKWINEVILNFWSMFDHRKEQSIPYKSYAGFFVLGFVGACIYLDEIVKHTHAFPYMAVWGESESGKSFAIRLLANIFGFTQMGESWESTVNSMSKMMEYVSSLIVWFDEFKNEQNKSHQTQKKENLLKNLWTRAGESKGTLSARDSFEVNGAMFLTGEDVSEHKAFRSRTVVIQKVKPTPTATIAYFWLEENSKNLSSIFLYLIKKKNEKTIKNFLDTYDNLVKSINEKIEEKGKKRQIDRRAVTNHATIATGFFVFDELQYKDEFVDYVVDHIIKESEAKEAEDILFKFFEDIDIVTFNLDEVIHFFDENRVFLWYQKLYTDWMINTKRSGLSQYISRNALKSYMEKHSCGFWIGNDRATLQGQQRRGITLDVNKMPEQMKEVVQNWWHSFQNRG